MDSGNRWLRCAQCGEPVVGATLRLDQFEDPDDLEAAGPIYHPGCVEAAIEAAPSVRVFMYADPDVGRLTGPAADEG